MYPIFGTENSGSIYFFRDWKPWIRILSCIMSDRSHVRRNSVEGGPNGEAPRESRGVWGAARPPNEGDGRKMVQSMDFGG